MELLVTNSIKFIKYIGYWLLRNSIHKTDSRLHWLRTLWYYKTDIDYFTALIE